MERTGKSVDTQPFELGEFRVEPDTNRLIGPSGEVSLEPKVMAVLLLLAERPNEVVHRRSFTDTIWAREHGGDESLTRAISILRKSFGNRGEHAYIETIPKKGYRLTLPAVDPLTPRPRPTWRPVLFAAILLVLVGVLVVRWWHDEPEPDQLPARAPLVAVLPFDSQTPVEADRYLAEGLADEILSAMTRRGEVAVIAGNSSFRFRGEEKKNLDELRKQLRVTHIVDGSVRRSAGQLRVGVHLVDAQTGLVTWSNVLNRPEREAYTIPPIVAGEVLAALGRRMSDSALDATSPPDPEAYTLFLAARAQMRADPGMLDMIIPTLEAVVEREPRLAEAWGNLALARLQVVIARPGRSTTGYRNRDPESRLSRARSEAHRALALDRDSPEAHLALAVVDYRARLLPLDEAERRFRQLVDMAPNYSAGNMRLGMMLVELGRYREALHYLRRASQLDPLSLTPAGFYHQYAVETGAAEEVAHLKDNERFSWHLSSYRRLVELLLNGEKEEAQAWLSLARERGRFWAHGVVTAEGEEGARDERLVSLLERVVAVAQHGDPELDTSLPADLVVAAEEGQLLHFYAASLLGAVGYGDPVFELVQQRLAVDDLYFRGALFRRAFKHLRETPRVMAWFDAGTQLDYWLKTEQWPDFCSEPALAWDCKAEALAYVARNRP